MKEVRRLSWQHFVTTLTINKQHCSLEKREIYEGIPLPRQLVIKRDEEYITDQSKNAKLMTKNFAGSCGEEPDNGEPH